MKNFLLIFVAISLFLILLQKVYEPDVFWHIKTGEIILKTKTIPDKEMFSFLTEGKDWTPPEWVGDIIFYLLYKTGGFSLLNVFSIIFYGATFFMIFLILLNRNVNMLVSAFLVTTSALAAYERSQPRPHIFTYFLLTVMIFFLDEYRLKGKKYIFFFPLISLLWANLHPESAMAVLVFLSIILMEAIKIYINRNIPENYSFLKLEKELSYGNFLVLSIIFLLSFALNFINPQTYRIFDFLFRHPDVIKNLEINEFMPLDIENLPYTFFSIVALAVISASGIKKNFHEIHLPLIFGFLTIKYRRFLPEFYIFALPAAGTAIQFYIDLSRNYLEKYLNENISRSASALVTIIFVIFVVISIKNLFYNDVYSFKGIGLHKKYFPTGAFEFIRRNHIKPRVYNTANLGGAFIFNFFPEQKAFEDTRLIFYEELVKYKLSPRKPDFSQLTQLYDFNYLLIDLDVMIYTQYPALINDWALVYFDDSSEIFVRRTPENEYIYKDKEFKAINPETITDMVEKSIENSMIPVTAIYEIRRALTLAPDSYMLHYALGSLLSIDPANFPEAEIELKKSIEIMPLYPYSNKNLARIYSLQGKYDEAVYYFERYVRCAEFNRWETLSDILNDFGLLYLKAGNVSMAKKIFKKAVKIDPKNTAALENLKALKN